MNKIFKSLISLFLAVFMVASLAVIPSSAAAALNKTSISLTKGYQTTLSVTGATGTVSWSTGDKNIATVSSAGKVVGKGVGTTYVYAQTGNTTLKCKVTVVAAKITASTSEVKLDKAGDTKTVTISVKGSHNGLSVGTTNKSVASASWVRPVQWDGDKIKFNITAKGQGTARIKVYLKNYSSTCFKYVDVNVGDYPVDDDVDTGSDSSSNMAIMPYTPNVSVAAGETYTLQVYSTNQNNLTYSVADTKIASVSAATTTNNYRNYTIKGLTAGTTTLKLYDKNNTKNYSDVKITVSNGAVYYEIYTTQPTKLLSTDVIIKVPVNSSTTYYMLAPAGYDPAYTNTLIAQKVNKYSYYEVYTSTPARSAATDTYKSFYHTNKKYNYGTRYVLLPANYDEVRLNTVIAKYNEFFEYYTVYNENPTTQDAWDDVKTWTVNDPVTGATVRRYMLVPYGYDQTRVDEAMAKDKTTNNTYSYYVPYETAPTVNKATDVTIIYYKNNTRKYMVIPRNSSIGEIVKANDAIYSDVKEYEYNVFYSSKPTAASDAERVAEYWSGRTVFYLLYKDNDFSSEAAALNYAEGNLADGIKDN